MDIRDCEYKGFKYKIKFTNDKETDWGKHINTFYCESNSGFYSNHYKDLEQAEAEIQLNIDKYLSAIPSTDDEWVEMIDECVVQDGYEDWHIDKGKVMHVLKTYAKSHGQGE